MKKKLKICCCFAVKPPTGLSWPGIAQDYSKRTKYYSDLLLEHFGEDFIFEFKEYGAMATDEDLQKLTEYDGCIVILLAHGTALAQRLAGILKHGLIIDDPYGGSGDAIRTANLIKTHGYPLAVTGTSDEHALLHRIHVYLSIPKIKNSRILVFKNFDKMPPEKELELSRSIRTGSTMRRYQAGRAGFEKTMERIRDVFGIEVIVKTLDDLEEYQKNVDEDQIKYFADKWADHAQAVVEPSYEDLLASARMHLGLCRAKEENNADVVSIDCILLFFAYDLGVYPCMSWFEMNNNGQLGVCESDLDSCITSLLIHHISGRPGLVSDPFVDTECNEIVYAHCVASNRPFGSKNSSCPYRIRTHGEDHESAAVQVLLPEGYPLTTIKVSAAAKAMSIHSGISAGNVEHESGCRTKLVCKVKDSKRIMNNWHDELFSWHRVTVYGDYRNDFIEAANYLGLKIYEEDRELT